MNIEKVIPLLLEEPRHFIATGGGIQTRPVKIKRPKWDDVYRGYPKNKSETDDLPAPDVFLSIFEKKYYEANVSLFSNACATRVSLGLIEGGMLVKTAFKITKKGHKYINKGFQTSAIGLKNWLSQENVWGSADEFIEAKNKGVYNSAIPDITLVDVQNKIKNRNGVYQILQTFHIMTTKMKQIMRNKSTYYYISIANIFILLIPIIYNYFIKNYIHSQIFFYIPWVYFPMLMIVIFILYMFFKMNIKISILFIFINALVLYFAIDYLSKFLMVR